MSSDLLTDDTVEWSHAILLRWITHNFYSADYLKLKIQEEWKLEDSFEVKRILEKETTSTSSCTAKGTATELGSRPHGLSMITLLQSDPFQELGFLSKVDEKERPYYHSKSGTLRLLIKVDMRRFILEGSVVRVGGTDYDFTFIFEKLPKVLCKVCRILDHKRAKCVEVGKASGSKVENKCTDQKSVVASEQGKELGLIYTPDLNEEALQIVQGLANEVFPDMVNFDQTMSKKVSPLVCKATNLTLDEAVDSFRGLELLETTTKAGLEVSMVDKKGKKKMVEKKKKHSHLSTLFESSGKRNRKGIVIQERSSSQQNVIDVHKKSVIEAGDHKGKEVVVEDTLTPVSTYLNLDRFGSVHKDILDMLQRNFISLQDLMVNRTRVAEPSRNATEPTHSRAGEDAHSLPTLEPTQFEKMRGHVTNEMDVVGASADEIWAVYGSHDLPRLIIDLQPGVFKSIDILEGDGGEGSVLHIVMADGIPGPREWKEKFVRMDNHKRVKVLQQIEGGYLDLGFSLYRVTYEILNKDCNSCIIRSTVTIDLDDKFESNASGITVDSMWGMAKSIVKYVLDNKAKTSSSTSVDC